MGARERRDAWPSRVRGRRWRGWGRTARGTKCMEWWARRAGTPTAGLLAAGLVMLLAVWGLWRVAGGSHASRRGERVVLVVPGAEDGCGVAVYARDLARHMAQAGDGAEVDLVVFRRHDRASSGEEMEREEEEACCRVVLEFDDRDAGSFARAGAFLGGSGRYGLAVVHHEFGLTVRGGTELGALMRAAREASGGALTLAVTLHSPFVRPTRDQAAVIGGVAAEADHVVVMAEAPAKALVGAYGVARRKVRVVPHGAQGPGGRAWTRGARERVRAWLGLPEDRALLVTAGLMHERKGTHLMTAAMRTVCASFPEVTYAVIGSHDRRISERTASAALLRDLATEVNAEVDTVPCVVVVEDYVPSFRELLAAADIVVTPYLEHTEVSGVITQAAALGVPLLASDTRYAEWTLLEPDSMPTRQAGEGGGGTDGGSGHPVEALCGVVVRQGDATGLARGASLLLAKLRSTSAESAWSRRKMCSARALRRHAWEGVAKRHMALLSSSTTPDAAAAPQLAPLQERERVAEVMLSKITPPVCLLSAAQIEVSMNREGKVTIRLPEGDGRVDVRWLALDVPRVAVDGSRAWLRPGIKVPFGGEGIGRMWALAASGWWEVATPDYLLEGSSDGLLRVVERHAPHAISSGVLGTDVVDDPGGDGVPTCASISRLGVRRTKGRKEAAPATVGATVALVQVGPFYEASGFAEVNRALAQELAASSDGTVLRWSGVDQDPEIRGGSSEAAEIEKQRWKYLAPRLVQAVRGVVGGEPRVRPPESTFHAVMGNAWPALGPSWTSPLPSASVWLQNQPWEYSSVPCSWAHQINAAVGRGFPLRILVPSLFSRRAYTASGVDQRLVSVVPHGVDAARFKADGIRLALEGETKLLFLGGALPRKGLDLLLRVFRDTFPPEDAAGVVLYVVSNYGTLAEDATEWTPNVVRLTDDRLRALYRAAASASSKASTVRDDVMPDVMPALMRSVDALVAPYRGEGFGLALAQAMASRLPVVVTRGGPALELCGPTSGDRCLLLDADLVPCAPPREPATHLLGECADTYRVSELNGFTCAQGPVAWFEPSESHLAAILRDLADAAAPAPTSSPTGQGIRRAALAAMARRARAGILADRFTWPDAAHQVLNHLHAPL